MSKRLFYLVMIAGLLLALLPAAAFAGPVAAPHAQGPWWDVTPEPEVPSPFYDSILYSEIAPKLREIETSSNRVRVEVIDDPRLHREEIEIYSLDGERNLKAAFE